MATQQQARTHSGIAQYSGTWDKKTALHLLRRVHCGVKWEDIDRFSKMSMNEAINRVLDIDYSIPSPPINNYSERNPDPNVPAGQTWINDYNGTFNNARMGSLRSWWFGEILNHDDTIREKMVLFWHNHFSTQTQVYNWANFGYNYVQLLRNDCLKNFKTMVKDVTLDPAMLVFLNGERNTKVAPDENYSRELQELFTLGKGPESQYTESDVIAGAKVLTGWRVNKSNGNVYFEANRHDETDKQFSAFYNNTVIAGKSGTQGPEELDDLLDMIFAQQEVAKHIVRKLYRWFIYYDIDETTENNVITPLANIFRNGNYEIKPVLEALLRSEHFYDVANRDALIKNPVDFTAGIIRNFDVELPGANEYIGQYQSWATLYNTARGQQMQLGDPPSVAGWPAYYQIPQYHELWINSDTLPSRNKITDAMISYGINISGTRYKIDPIKYNKKLSNPGNPNDVIDDMLLHLHTLEVDQAQKDYMKSILLGGQINDSYWTNAWQNHINYPNSETKATVVSSRLAFLIKYLMNLAEFQLS